MTMDDGPLAGARVLDLAVDRAGSVCAMLLADLGADVVRPETRAGEHRRRPPQEHLAAQCWDRGKRRSQVAALGLDDAAIARLVELADVVILDGTPAARRASASTPEAIAARNPHAVVAWLPPNGVQGEAADVPEDPSVLAAMSGFAQWQTSIVDEPVLPVVPYLAQVQGALGASVALAALLERRTSGAGQIVTVSGLHTTALMLATVSGRSLDQPMAYTAPRDSRGSAPYRLYRGSDDRWFFLGSLVPSMFIAALDAIDMVEVMVLPGIDGDFMNLFVGDNGRRVADALEARFAERPASHWLDVLGAAGVPAAAVVTPDEWAASETFAAIGGFDVRDHPSLGPVRLPAPPLALSATPVRSGVLADASPVVDAHDVWRSAIEADDIGAPEGGHRAEPLDGPALAGRRVLDLSTFLAGPTGATLLGQWGAEVIKVEPRHGDPFRLYNVSYAAANQGKRRVVLDLASAEGLESLRSLVAGADVLIDNFRPSLRHRLGITTEWLHAANPQLVHTTLTAFGDDGPLADSPGFDPIIQACSGLMHACGDAEGPYYTSTPVHDVAAGSLIALGTLAALHARASLGRGQRVSISLAGSSRLVQGDELTSCTAIASVGSLATGRAIRVGDGWVAIPAGGPDASRSLTNVRDLDRASAVVALRSAGIAAVAVVERHEVETDAHLLSHRLLHTVHDSEVGQCLVVDQVATWSRSQPQATATAPSREPGDARWITARLAE